MFSAKGKITAKGRIILSLLIALGLSIWLRSLLSFNPDASDFGQDIRAVENLRQGKSIYDNTGNAHPPFNILIFYPFALINQKIAFVIFGLLSSAAYAFSLLLIGKGLSLPKHWAYWAILGSLFWVNFYGCVALGALSPLISIGVVGGWYALKTERATLAGILLGFAGLIKPYPLLLGLYLLLAKKFRTIFSLIVTVLVGSLLTLWTVGLSDNIAFVTEVLPKMTGIFKPFIYNASLVGVIHRLIGPQGGWVKPLIEAPTATTICISVMTVFVLLFSAKRVRRFIELGEDDRAFSLLCVVMLLISPIAWGHYFLVLMLPLMLVARDVFQQKSSVSRVGLLVVALFLSGLDHFISRRIEPLFLSAQPIPWDVALFYTFPTIGLLGLLACLLAGTKK